MMSDKTQPQFDKFKETAHALECDDDDQRFKDWLKKLVKQRPVQEKPE
jgi:hypothetical protein